MRDVLRLLLIGVFAAVAGPAAASFTVGGSDSERRPFVTLVQPSVCVIPGTCERAYEFGYSFGEVLDSPSGVAPNVLSVSGMLSEPVAHLPFFFPYKICCSSGSFTVSLTTGPLVGVDPEVHVAIMTGEFFRSRLADIHGPGSAQFTTFGGGPFYAVVYGAGVTNLPYQLTVTAVPEPKIFALMIAGLALIVFAARAFR